MNGESGSQREWPGELRLPMETSDRPDPRVRQCPGMLRRAPTLLSPLANPSWLSLGRNSTVSWMSAVRRRVGYQPEKVAGSMAMIHGAMVES